MALSVGSCVSAVLPSSRRASGGRKVRCRLQRVGSEGEEECGAREKSSSGAAWSTLDSLAGALCVACIVREREDGRGVSDPAVGGPLEVFWFLFLFYLFGSIRSSLRHVGSSFLSRDGPQAPALRAQTLSYWTTRGNPWGDLWTGAGAGPREA